MADIRKNKAGPHVTAKGKPDGAIRKLRVKGTPAKSLEVIKSLRAKKAN